MSRSVPLDQSELAENDKCEGGICKSNDREWTEYCAKHKKWLDRATARWAYYRRTGIDLEEHEEVPNA